MGEKPSIFRRFILFLLAETFGADVRCGMAGDLVGEKPSVYRRSVFSFLAETFGMDVRGSAAGIAEKCGGCCGEVRWVLR